MEEEMRRMILWPMLISISACGIISTKTTPEGAPVDDTVDFFYGDRVSDPYRTLEEDGTSEVEEWSAKHEQKQAGYWKNSSVLPKIKERLIALEKQQSPGYSQPIWAGNKLFALKTVPPKNQPMLVSMPSWENPGQETVIVDPNIIDPSGNTAVDWYVPSHDGSMVAVSMSKNDTEMGNLYIYEIEKKNRSKVVPKKVKGKAAQKVGAESSTDATREPFPKIDDVILGVHRALGGGSVAWAGDDSGFYYTKYPDDEGDTASLSEQVYFHKLGGGDKKELGSQFDRIARIQLESDPKSNRVIATVQRGAMPEFMHYLRDPEGDWQKLSDFSDGAVTIVFAPEGGFFVISRQDAGRGKVLYLPSPKVPLAQAKRLLPETNDTILTEAVGHRSFLVTSTRLYINYLTTAGVFELRAYSHDGKQVDTLSVPDAAPGASAVHMDREEILVPIQSYSAKDAWYRYDGQLGKGSLVKTGLSTSGAEMSDVQITKVEAKAKDGAQLPITLVHKGALTGSGNRPVLMIADGSFGHVLLPRYSLLYRFFMEQGGVLAAVTIRGGGEFGENWHTAGKLVHKQNTFDDFYSCAQFLISKKYTNKDKLAIRGIDDSALIAGVMLTQHPDSFGAVTAESGIYDMMRNEYSAAGEGAVLEYGTNADETQYRTMIAYSPYHHVPERTAFPSSLFIVGRNDFTVAGWHTRKMVARLEEKNTGLSPILFQSEADVGHRKNIPYMKKLDKTAEILTFLFQSLKITLQ
jgi:prolyl oligopeptidase